VFFPGDAPDTKFCVGLDVMFPKPRFTALCFIAAALAISACARSDTASVGGPFHLTDQGSRPQDQSLLQGKWSAVFFGYTYCPDVCPTTLQALGEAQDRLGPKAAGLQVVFISVDPGRDTPAQLKTYLSNPAFPKGTIGLTGTPAQVAEAAKAYHVFYQPTGTGTDYAVQHSSAVYLMDKGGRFNRVIAYGLSPDEMARQISEAMGG
jgi:protein SCO1/2